ncbi:hypothetical protein ACFQV2_34055 [Actinokineospora soli]|uniref:Uncharacterized protein n=1 Tax=Actinokineospora soli TaxID=1048753 RepID=A0ABW2TX91_9PSEU
MNAGNEDGLSGIAEWKITPTLSPSPGPSARQTAKPGRGELATAVLVDAETMVTYDDRSTGAARSNGITVSSPA